MVLQYNPYGQVNLKGSQVPISHSKYSADLFETGLFYDCIISCQHQRWHLHRAVLAQRCDFFRACFLHGFQEATPSCIGGCCEIKMNEDEPESLRRMLRWLYTLEYPSLDQETSILRTGPSEKSDVPDNFWTSELSLFVVADKYDLTRLAEQSSVTICDAARRIPTSREPTSTDRVPFSSFDDFVDMLEMIYTDMSSVSPSAKQLKANLISGSAMTIAAYASGQPRLSNLVTTIPEFATDLVQALRRIAEVSNSTIVGINRSEKFEFDAARSLEAEIGWSGYRNGSESDGSSRSPGGHRGRIYVPMNEDSDTD